MCWCGPQVCIFFMTQPVASCFTFAGLHLLHMRAVVSTVGDVASKDTDSVEQIAEDVSNACQDGSQQARAVVMWLLQEILPSRACLIAGVHEVDSEGDLFDVLHDMPIGLARS